METQTVGGAADMAAGCGQGLIEVNRARCVFIPGQAEGYQADITLSMEGIPVSITVSDVSELRAILSAISSIVRSWHLIARSLELQSSRIERESVTVCVSHIHKEAQGECAGSDQPMSIARAIVMATNKILGQD